MSSRFVPMITSSILGSIASISAHRQTSVAEIDAEETLAAETAQQALMEKAEESEGEDCVRQLLVDLESAFNGNIAAVYMQAEADGSHYFNAHHPLLPDEDTRLLSAVGKEYSLPILVESERDPDDILGYLRRFSDKKENAFGVELSRWIQRVIKVSSDDLCCLVIYDGTGLEIPWEMIRIDNELLGTVFPIVRLPNLSSSIVQVIGQTIHPEVVCHGEIVAYTNRKDLKKAVDREIKSLEQYKSVNFKNFTNFKNHIHKEESAPGIVFIASHGHFGEEGERGGLDDIWIDTPPPENVANKSSKRQSFYALSSWDRDIFKSSNSIIFFNACHTARITNKDSADSGSLNDMWEGWATLFLDDFGAKGFIGTLAKVGNEEAAAVTEYFFAEYEEDPSLTVPEILRNIRRTIQEDYNRDRSAANAKSLLYASMYTYYGQPMARLRLIKRGEDE